MTDKEIETKFLEFLVDDIESKEVAPINKFLIQKIELLIKEVEFGDLNEAL
jgi:hypothetical protein